MANTFKVKTLSAIKSDSADTLYSCAQSTTAVLLGLTVTNTNTTSAITFKLKANELPKVQAFLFDWKPTESSKCS